MNLVLVPLKLVLLKLCQGSLVETPARFVSTSSNTPRPSCMHWLSCVGSGTRWFWEGVRQLASMSYPGDENDLHRSMRMHDPPFSFFAHQAPKHFQHFLPKRKPTPQPIPETQLWPLTKTFSPRAMWTFGNLSSSEQDLWSDSFPSVYQSNNTAPQSVFRV